MARAHYHVGYNMTGYLPEMDPYTVSTKRDAINAARTEARMLNDDPCSNDAHYHGNYVQQGSDGDYYLMPRECANVGGAQLHVWYSGPCVEPDCDDDIDNS